MSQCCRGCRSTIGSGEGFCPRCGLSAPPATALLGVDLASTPVAPPPARTGVLRHLGGRVLPAVAVVACLVGVLGLELPVVQVFGDDIAFSTADVPYVGNALLLLFVVLTLFPVLDVVRGRSTFTPWLVVPGLLGLVPLALVELGLSYVPPLADLVHTAVPDAVVVLGAGPDVLLGADLALIVLGVAAVALRLRARSVRAVAVELAPQPVAPWASRP